MARGHQKIQSQKKNQERQSKQRKQTDHKSAAKKALVHSCPVCRAQMPDPKTFKQHFESKHPKAPMPDELKDVVA